VQVAVIAPSDPASAGHDELQGIGSGDDRPPMGDLAQRPWLTQADAILGTYVLAGGVLEDGDIMQMRHDLPQIVGVVAAPGADGAHLLRVVLLA
jgi:hypothetical protein